MAKRPSGPVRYIYLDVAGIDSLHSQTVETVEAEITTTKRSGRNSRITGKASIGKVIASLFGLPELGADASVTALTDQTEMAKSYKTAEQKLAKLLEHLHGQGEPTFFTDLQRAATHTTGMEFAVFVCVQDRFDIAAYRESGKMAEDAINKDGAIVFERCQQTDASKADLPVTMAASLLNCPEARNGVLGRMSHLAVMFHALGGSALPLRVFGSIVPLRDTWQIKPYAIW